MPVAGTATSRDGRHSTGAVAERLASSADRVADLLADDDVCGAAHAADEIHAAVIQAVNAGEVPPVFQESLGSAAAELVNAVNCGGRTEDGDD